jgi:DNA-binding MarR family transcriptional regulator
VEFSERLRYLILASEREANRALTAALRPYGLTPSQAEAIDVLRKAPRPLTVREVGDRLIREHGSPSRLMRTLVKKGLVESLPAQDDGRLKLMALTAQGRRAARRMQRVKEAIDRRIEPLLAEHDVEAACALLEELTADLPAGRALSRRIGDEQNVGRIDTDARS